MVGKDNLRTEDLNLCFDKLMMVAGSRKNGKRGNMKAEVIKELKDILVERCNLLWPCPFITFMHRRRSARSSSRLSASSEREGHGPVGSQCTQARHCLVEVGRLSLSPHRSKESHRGVVEVFVPVAELTGMMTQIPTKIGKGVEAFVTVVVADSNTL
ncbi:F-box protein [Sesbania bispinosa]|nr:F-box protein [Sesbania bispinosa]